jgi:hypothetical protein
MFFALTGLFSCRWKRYFWIALFYCALSLLNYLQKPGVRSGPLRPLEKPLALVDSAKAEALAYPKAKADSLRE